MYNKQQKEHINKIMKTFKKEEVHEPDMIYINEKYKVVELDYMPETLIIEGKEINIKDLK